MNELNRKWKNYVKQQMDAGGAQLFKYIARNDKSVLNVSYDTHGQGCSTPGQFLKQQAKLWNSYWNPNNTKGARIASELTNLREAALEIENKKPFNVESLDLALTKYKKISLGSDVWAPKELKSLPGQCKEWIANSINHAQLNIVVPHQMLISLNPLLGKPNFGCRTICKTPMLYRMCLRADDEINEWEDNNKQKYDKATKKSSALLAALWRNLMAELAYWLGDQFAAVLNDFEKFFDTLDIETLMVEAVHTDFPLRKLCFALQQHLAPRILQANGNSSKPLTVNQSILAGCKFSVAITRMYLKRNFTQIVKEEPKANPELFVDDSSMHATATDSASIAEILVPAMLSFKEKCINSNLNCLPKLA